MEEAITLGLRHRAMEAMDLRNFARAAVVLQNITQSRSRIPAMVIEAGPTLLTGRHS
jgi:hypothetical protein